MKYWISLLAAALFSLPIATHAAVGSNLVGCWNFNESSGNAADSSTNAFDLTNNNTATFTTGLINNATDLETGSAQRFTRADNVPMSITGDLSYSTWIKPESNGERALMSKYGAPPNQAYRMYTASATNIAFTIWNAAGSQTETSWTVTDIGTGSWVHLAVTYDAANHSCELYINAVSQTAKDCVRTDIRDTSADFEIGGGVAYAASWDGLIDISALWAYELSSSDVTALYNSGTGVDCATIVTTATGEEWGTIVKAPSDWIYTAGKKGHIKHHLAFPHSWI